MHIAIITAGGAGMYCGSCMHDNTWARALLAHGHQVSLIPTYTPLRVDEDNASLNRVFLGGINVYLNGKFNWWKRVPRFLTSWLDSPGIIRMATRGSVSNNAAELGDLTISMLQGTHGPHRAAIEELAGFLATHLRPDVVIFSNALLAGAVEQIQQAWPAPVLCTLQGDDVFLDSLPVDVRQQAVSLVSEQARRFDAFITHTEFYRNYISRYLSLSAEDFKVLPLGIELHEHTGRPGLTAGRPYTVGYFARFAPEKGLHHLVDAFELVQSEIPTAQLHIGGYQGSPYNEYVEQMQRRLKQSGLNYKNIGSPDTVEKKVEFFTGIDAFSVPTDFLEPKGMYVLEAMANGVPVVQPAHGSFPELLHTTQGGKLVEPRNARALADALIELSDPQVRIELAQRAYHGVREHYDVQQMAVRTTDLLDDILNKSKAKRH